MADFSVLVKKDGIPFLVSSGVVSSDRSSWHTSWISATVLKTSDSEAVEGFCTRHMAEDKFGVYCCPGSSGEMALYVAARDEILEFSPPRGATEAGEVFFPDCLVGLLCRDESPVYVATMETEAQAGIMRRFAGRFFDILDAWGSGMCGDMLRSRLGIALSDRDLILGEESDAFPSVGVARSVLSLWSLGMWFQCVGREEVLGRYVRALRSERLAQLKAGTYEVESVAVMESGWTRLVLPSAEESRRLGKDRGMVVFRDAEGRVWRGMVGYVVHRSVFVGLEGVWDMELLRLARDVPRKSVRLEDMVEGVDRSLRAIMEVFYPLQPTPLIEEIRDLVQQRKSEVTPLEEMAGAELSRRLPPKLSTTLRASPHLNAAQSCAILQMNEWAVTAVQGPPGTGKTRTIAATAHAICSTRPESTVLIVTPSDKLADAYAAVLQQELERQSSPAKVVRLNSERRNVDTVAPLFRDFCARRILQKQTKSDSSISHLAPLYDRSIRISAYEREELRRLEIRHLTEILRHANIVVCTCQMAGAPEIQPLLFDFVFMDEATRCTVPESCIALLKARYRAMIIGDQKQMGPIVYEQALQGILGISFFEHVFRPGEHRVGTISLSDQYRMHPSLCKFPSDTFYDGKLRTMVHPNDLQVPFRLLDANRAIFLDTKSPQSTHPVTHSSMNMGEVEVVHRVVTELLTKVDHTQIMVLTPYRSQETLLSAKVEIGDAPVMVATIDDFQGGESDYIVVSTVVSFWDDPTKRIRVGFLNDPRRLNVLLTRARRALILIGNVNVLDSNSPVWSAYIKSPHVQRVSSTFSFLEVSYPLYPPPPFNLPPGLAVPPPFPLYGYGATPSLPVSAYMGPRPPPNPYPYKPSGGGPPQIISSGGGAPQSISSGGKPPQSISSGGGPPQSISSGGGPPQSISFGGGAPPPPPQSIPSSGSAPPPQSISSTPPPPTVPKKPTSSWAVPLSFGKSRITKKPGAPPQKSPIHSGGAPLPRKPSTSSGAVPLPQSSPVLSGSAPPPQSIPSSGSAPPPQSIPSSGGAPPPQSIPSSGSAPQSSPVVSPPPPKEPPHDPQPHVLAALFGAAKHGDAKVIRQLCQDGVFVDPDVCLNEAGDSALSIASRNAHRACVVVLLRHGANPNHQNRHGASPLHEAVQVGSRDCVLLLIGAGADPTLRDNRSQTPRDFVKTFNHKKLKPLLFE